MNTDPIARAIHDGWWQFMLMNGWRLGPRNARAKTHPHLVHWEFLDEDSRDQDIAIAYVLMQCRSDLSEVTPKDIHEAWCECDHRVDHPHKRPYAEAHALSAGEHWLQSILIRAVAPKLQPTPGENLIGSVQSITNILLGMAKGLRANPGVLANIGEMVELTHAVDNAQNACIELNRAVSVAHNLWLARVHPELVAGHDDWAEHERAVQEYIRKHESKRDLPAVLADIDVTP